MQRRYVQSIPLAVVTAASLTFAAVAGAQEPTPRSDTTVTSTRRIPVQKMEESRGAIATDSAAMADSLARERARQDSIDAANRARQDSIDAANRARQDSIAAAERARQEELARIERARQDSIAAAERARLAAEERFRAGRFNGWYFNLGGGASIPMGDFDNLYGTGFNVTGSVGWHPTESAFGIRFDVGYDRLNGETFAPGGGAPAVDLSDAAIWSGLGEVTLRIPRALGLNPYIVAGGGVYRFSDYGSDGGTSIYGDGDSESSTEWGWNAGGGLRFGWGFTSLFVEARYASVGAPGGNDRAEWVPIILGITFR
jgi:hypothetical protein